MLAVLGLRVASVRRWISSSRRACASLLCVVACILLGGSSRADVEILPPPPCTEATERGFVDVSEFRRSYETPEGHFTIWFELDSQRTEDPNGTCFPILFKGDNALRFVENVGAVLEQVYSFYAGDYATAAFPDLGFDMRPSINVKLYNADTSAAVTGTIRLKVQHVYDYAGGEYRFLPQTIVHELFHIVQLRTAAPEAPNPLFDWFYEGQAQYAQWYLASQASGHGTWEHFFGPAKRLTSFWDLSETMELGSYHHGGRLWRYLTYNWPVEGISEADRTAATYQITIPNSTGAESVYYLRPQRGIYLLQGTMAALDARVEGGTCPPGDECFRAAVEGAIGAGNWVRPDGHLFSYDQAYRAYAAANVELEGPAAGHPLFQRLGGQFKSSGLVGKTVDQAVIRTYGFETQAVDDYTVLVIASAENGGQNGTGDDDDLRFELDGRAFGGWDSSDSFNGNALHGLTVARFLRTSALTVFSSGLPAGAHTLTVYGDETPAIKQVRVVRGDIGPILAEEWIPLTYHGTTAPGCPDDYNCHAGYEVSTPSPLMMLANATLQPPGDLYTLFRVNGDSQVYPDPPMIGTLTYASDAPQMLRASRTGGVPVTLRTELAPATPTWSLDVCTRVTGTTELYTMDSLYLYPVPASDQFLEIHGHLHEYSTQYETLVLDPEATSVEISLEGATAGRFLTVHGQLFAGDKVLLSPDVWQPEAEQPFRYRLKMPGAQYGRLIVGVGAYGFEGYDPSLVDVTQRTTIPYTLRIVTRYGEPPGEYTVFLSLVAYGH